MRAGVAGLLLIMGLVPASSSAQDGRLHTASLPARPPVSSLEPVREDVYRARPDTYRPDPNRRSLPGFGYFAPQFFYPLVQPIIVVVPDDAAEPARVAPRVPPTASGPPPPYVIGPPEPYVAGVPGRPTHFYIIPGCYAGDRRPAPESLAPGCSLTRLRVVPPS
jgi:hypothetical protein